MTNRSYIREEMMKEQISYGKVPRNRRERMLFEDAVDRAHEYSERKGQPSGCRDRKWDGTEYEFTRQGGGVYSGK